MSISLGVDLIGHERARQIKELGWTAEHDDMHDGGELALAAAFYAQTPRSRVGYVYRQLSGSRGADMRRSAIYPFNDGWFSVSKFEYGSHHNRGFADLDRRIHELAVAGALAAAEIDRLVRIKASALDRTARVSTDPNDALI